MTWLELVHDVSPVEISDETADYILWEHTGFPEFWNIPEDGKTPEECCRKELKTYFDNTIIKLFDQ